MYSFRTLYSKKTTILNFRNKIIKKKSNNFISQKKIFPKKEFNIQSNDHDFSKINELLKTSAQFISIKKKISFNKEKTLDELLKESNLLIICTKYICTNKKYNKQLYKKIFGNEWCNIQSLL